MAEETTPHVRERFTLRKSDILEDGSLKLVETLVFDYQDNVLIERTHTKEE